MAELDEFFAGLWLSYTGLNPLAVEIQRLLKNRGESPQNDHIALRTFARTGISLHDVAAPFVARGYRSRGKYDFPGKKLRAEHFEHTHPNAPKVFISELLVDRFPAALQQAIRDLCQDVPADLVTGGRTWSCSYSLYQELREHSEYAAWLAVHGFRPNHFTIAVHELETFASLAELNIFLQDSGVTLSDAGGVIKGNPSCGLEQSSTVAADVEVAFIDGHYHVPGCYYEFAFRHPGPDGQLYSGFVPASADKLFESTDYRSD